MTGKTVTIEISEAECVAVDCVAMELGEACCYEAMDEDVKTAWYSLEEKIREARHRLEKTEDGNAEPAA